MAIHCSVVTLCVEERNNAQVMHRIQHLEFVVGSGDDLFVQKYV